MAARKPSAEFESLLLRPVQQELLAREKTLKASLSRLARTHKDKPAAVVERAVQGAAKKAGISVHRDTVKRVAALIREGEPRAPKRSFW
ncbi:hypothetical protein [Modestobacter sp. SYSU DS0875]